MINKGDQQLFNEFPAISRAQWEERINSDLKGTGNLDQLTWETDEGIGFKPFYCSEDLQSLEYLEHAGKLKGEVSTPNGWVICQEVTPGKDIREAKGRIRTALEGGAQAIRIALKNHPSPDGRWLGSLLEGVPMEETEVLFHGSLGADALYPLILDVAGSKGVSPSHLKGCLGADPLGMMSTSGLPIASMENLGRLVRQVRNGSPGLRTIEADGSLFQNSGSNLVQDLAFTLAMASDYMVILTDQGIEPQEAQDAILLRLAAGSNYFMEIAKLRAARILWQKISAAFGTGPEKRIIRIHSASTGWNMTLYDPHINMLRGTTEAMSSILGGADLVSVLPFNDPYGTSSLFADRIARNVQIILREESYFNRVSDPASGSYYIETLTDAITRGAWELFCKVELKGGFRKAFEAGWIQEHIASSRKHKIERTTYGKRKILGTNAYPVFDELILENLETHPMEDTRDLPLIPLKPFRLASIFEALRLETERSGKRPRVLLFRFGDSAWRNARATFSGNFFACAGYEILKPHAFDPVADGIAAARELQADLVVLCSSDDAYAETAPGIQKALQGLSTVVVAGYPSDSIEILQNAGIEHFIHSKSNLLETLKAFNRLLL